MSSDEISGVEIGEAQIVDDMSDVTKLRLQLVTRLSDEASELTEHSGGVSGNVRKPLRAKDDQRQEPEYEELRRAQVERHFRTPFTGRSGVLASGGVPF